MIRAWTVSPYPIREDAPVVWYSVLISVVLSTVLVAPVIMLRPEHRQREAAGKAALDWAPAPMRTKMMSVEWSWRVGSAARRVLRRVCALRRLLALRAISTKNGPHAHSYKCLQTILP